MRIRIWPLWSILLISACGGGQQPAPAGDEALVIGGESAATSSLYQMPTPNELFGLVRQLAGDGHKRMMAPASQAGSFASLRGRAINFGVFATDLVYASSFKLNVEVARYYLASKKLADGLGLSQAFTDADFVRLESNLTRGDSLEFISNEAYQRAYDRMQREDMGPVLCLVLAGGWMETMHLVVQQVEAFGKSDALMVRVAEQKATLEHLVSLMDQHRDDADVAAVQAQLIGLREIYDQVSVKRRPNTSTPSNGRLVLGDDMTFDLTPERYAELASAVERIRAEWITPEKTAAQ
jgi:hypothetical protein